MIQVIVMSSDYGAKALEGFFYLWEKYYQAEYIGIVAGFSRPDIEFPAQFRFISQGDQADFPPQRWSMRLNQILKEIADEIFILMLDDYWLMRQVDSRAIKMIYDYMFQFRNVIKFDLATDRLYADGGGKYLWNNNTYNHLGYLDLIKSDHASPYHLSLWGGMWRRDLLKEILIPGETAQQIELNGTNRLSQYGDELLVLGTRQAPLVHINALQGREWNYGTMGISQLSRQDQEELRALGYEL